MAIYIGLGNLAGGTCDRSDEGDKTQIYNPMARAVGLTYSRIAMASNFYREQDAPQYVLGHSLELAFVVVGMLAVLTLRFTYQRINKKRDLLDPSEYPDDPDELGDRSPLFRYML